MRTVYIDTGAFIALLWRRDRAHGAVAAHYRRLRQSGDRLVTCDPVIGETATRLRYDAGLDSVTAFARIIRGATGAGSLTVRESDADLRDRGSALMARYEGLRLSYADAVGAAVAEEIDADAIFGLDSDFHVLGHVLEPEQP